MREEGFYVGSGILHAPGTALTIQLQEDFDTLSMFQALNAGAIISKDLLFKDISETDRAELGEAALLRWVDWEANGDPDFFAHRHISPVPTGRGDEADEADEAWIFCGTTKFSGKRLRLPPGASATVTKRGVHNLLVWSGTGAVSSTRGDRRTTGFR